MALGHLTGVFQMNFLKSIIECWICAFSRLCEKSQTVVHGLATSLKVFIAKLLHVFCCVLAWELPLTSEWFARQQVLFPPFISKLIRLLRQLRCTNPYHVVSQCSLMPGCRLACGDQRRLTGSGSALEVVLHDYALYKSTFTLLYFTLGWRSYVMIRFVILSFVLSVSRITHELPHDNGTGLDVLRSSFYF